MSGYQLVIGNKNYSSWSLRAGLLLRHAGMDFSERLIPLYQEHSKTRLLEASPVGQVPILKGVHGLIHDSLAIAEYIHDLMPDAGFWPGDMAQRAKARAITAEMHTGFAALRAELPMNMRAQKPHVTVSDAAQQDIQRVIHIWQDCLTKSRDGDFLFGRFGIADAFYAPVASRFRTYGIDLPPESQAWSDAIFALPAMQDWQQDAEIEPFTIDDIDAL